MTDTHFFRLLEVDIDEKGEALRTQITGLNEGSIPADSSEAGTLGETFTADPADFSKIPQSPFAYWVGESIRRLFVEMPSVEERGISVQHGASTKRDFRFVRLWWEVAPAVIGSSAEDTRRGRPWIPFAKGGAYSPFYADVHLLINWRNEGEEIETYVLNRYPYLKGNASWILHPENDYFSPGLTWPNSTTLQMSTRVLPLGCIFAHMGPTAFVKGNDEDKLAELLGVINSSCFLLLVSLQLGLAAAGRKHYEVGIIRRTPLPTLTAKDTQGVIRSLPREAHDSQRSGDLGNEITHAFGIPRLVRHREQSSLRAANESARVELRVHARRLGEIQDELDEIAFDLYDLDEKDRALICGEVERPKTASSYAYQGTLEQQTRDLLMWCVGVAFGRWDVRKALDPSRLPPLGDPFDPLPRCAPGALVGEDGLPLPQKDLPDDYPLPIAWDGILVDDPDHPSDIVGRVQGVLDLLWGERAGAIEREICEIIGVDRLRDYFRDYRNGFFAFHAKRYSKSRRKAPIYWLLQSKERHYAVWLYYHRLDTSMLYAAGRGYADAKVELEQGRLQTLQQGADALEGSARRRRYREIERQKGVVQDVRALRNKLDQIALLDLAFDLNDGVLLNIAPLHEMVPWKYADRTWKRFQEGRYGWSSMVKQLRTAGLIERTSKD